MASIISPFVSSYHVIISSSWLVIIIWKLSHCDKAACHHILTTVIIIHQYHPSKTKFFWPVLGGRSATPSHHPWSFRLTLTSGMKLWDWQFIMSLTWEQVSICCLPETFSLFTFIEHRFSFLVLFPFSLSPDVDLGVDPPVWLPATDFSQVITKIAEPEVSSS